MKLYRKTRNAYNHADVIATEQIFGMANLTMKRTGLDVDIWAEHKGILRNGSHNKTPSVIIGKPGEFSISVTISDEPIIEAKSSNIKKSELAKCRGAIEYVARNSDIFLRHYMDKDDSFDDTDLYEALRLRGDYR